MTGLFAKAWIAARSEEDPAADIEAFAAPFAATRKRSSVLPWDVVQDKIKEAKGRAEIFSENFVLGIAKSQVDPAMTASGEVSSDLVPTVVGLRYALTTTVPLNNEVVEVYSRLIAANKVTKDNIWLTREYILGSGRRASGRSPSGSGTLEPTSRSLRVSSGSIRAKTVNGEDSDSNGFVDDINGIAHDKDGNRSPFLLHPKGDMAGRVDEALNYTKGFMDLTSSIDSDEATELKKPPGIHRARPRQRLHRRTRIRRSLHARHPRGGNRRRGQSICPHHGGAVELRLPQPADAFDPRDRQADRRHRSSTPSAISGDTVSGWST